jgi:urease accessory protein UreE
VQELKGQADALSALRDGAASSDQHAQQTIDQLKTELAQSRASHATAMSDAKSAFVSRLLALDHHSRQQLQAVIQAAEGSCTKISAVASDRLHILSESVKRSVEALQREGQRMVDIRESLHGKLRDSRDDCRRLESLLENAQQAGSGTAADLQVKAAELQKTIALLSASQQRCVDLEATVATLTSELKVMMQLAAAILFS